MPASVIIYPDKGKIENLQLIEISGIFPVRLFKKSSTSFHFMQLNSWWNLTFCFSTLYLCRQPILWVTEACMWLLSSLSLLFSLRRCCSCSSKVMQRRVSFFSLTFNTVNLRNASLNCLLISSGSFRRVSSSSLCVEWKSAQIKLILVEGRLSTVKQRGHYYFTLESFPNVSHIC